MSYQSGPFGPGYTFPGGPPGGGAPPGGGGPWGPPPGGGIGGGFGGGPSFGPDHPPPPPPRKSNTGLIIGAVVALVLVVPMCAGIAIYAAGSYAARATSDVGTAPDLPPAPPPPPAGQERAGQQGLDAPVPAPAGYRPVRRVGFSYVVPATWTEVGQDELKSPMIEAAQRNPVPSGDFMTNVNVAGEPFTGDGPAYGAANLVQLQTVATIRGQRLATSGTRSAWDIEAFWPNTGGVPYVTLQRYVTSGTKGYVITCSAGSAVFATQRLACETILSSFRVD